MSRSIHQIYHVNARALIACNGRSEFFSAAIWSNANCRADTSYTCMNIHVTAIAYTQTTYITYCSQLNTHCVSVRHNCILHPPTSSIHYVVYTINSFYIDRQVDAGTKRSTQYRTFLRGAAGHACAEPISDSLIVLPPTLMLAHSTTHMSIISYLSIADVTDRHRNWLLLLLA